ncbi:MAG: hypothetical protein HC905_26825 [Bacteroidales bacterium]|nr:hypothetical protein [Bacteroidales bacterium]
MDKIDLFKYIEGDCSDEEKILITTWIDSSPENMKEYAAFRKLYDISLWQSMPYNEKGSSGNKTLKHIYIEIIKIAAILLIGFFLTTLFLIMMQKIYLCRPLLFLLVSGLIYNLLMGLWFG